ncbi:hypothetical protein GPA19_07895 [Azoarcus indigens]|uniref:Uncharacterized protein n=1 Tax=Azoarcus indigens TaxID=29545 RepID=A0A4R6DZP6_9RHOO|nr:hypothetical protein [Azoarcus indigens]NMG64865.1 hypothetical protein [Azoarcus indigens]TDN50404.1 hypothetical protein C7389_10998 [Azoarcus indigens]
MQEATIIDPDGVTRRYALDSYDGRLFVHAGKATNRPYKPVFAAGSYDNPFILHGAHAAFWRDPEAAAKALAAMPPDIAWRGAW